MILWDVHILVYAFRSDSPYHGQSRRLIDGARLGGKPYLLNTVVAASFVRLVTNQRIFAVPSESAEAWRFVEFLEAEPTAHLVDIDAHTHAVFKHFCLVSDARGNDVPDALLAAVAVRNRARLVTADRGFQRFAGLAVDVVGLANKEQ